MKPKIDERKCCALEDICPVIKACPENAVSYIEVDEPVDEKEISCGCGCGCSCEEDLISNGKIIIDYDKCIECGICVDECCGTAINMV